MTTIGLVANDQLLAVVLNPKVASGDQNTVDVHIDFSDDWDGFAKSAVFFSSNDTNAIYEKVLTNGECIVPAEVMAEQGILYIGVRGVKAPNNEVKTTSLVKYKISEGAPTGTGTEVEPTADVYQQLLTAYGETNDAINFERSRIDNIIAHNNDTEGNTELIDIRVGANGITYNSAGEAIREQISNLKSADEKVREQIGYLKSADEAVRERADYLKLDIDNVENALIESGLCYKNITEYEKTYLGDDLYLGNSKIPYTTEYYGFATRIKKPAVMNGVRIYIGVPEDTVVTCQLWSQDRSKVLAETQNKVPHSVYAFVDFIFDSIDETTDENIYVAIKADTNCFPNQCVKSIDINTEFVTADTMDLSGQISNLRLDNNGIWQPIQSLSSPTIDNLVFTVIYAEFDLKTKVYISDEINDVKNALIESGLCENNITITECEKTFTNNASGTSSVAYYGFATRIKKPEKINGVRVYTMVSEDTVVTCQILGDDRIKVLAESQKSIAKSNAPDFVDFLFDSIGSTSDENIYVVIKSDTKCICQACTRSSNINTELVTANNLDETGATNNYFKSGTSWSAVKSTSNAISFTLQFIVLYTEAEFKAKVDLSKYKIPVMNYIYVSLTGSDVTGDGSELKPYATIYHANESITDNSEYNRYTIKVADGTYTDLQERYAGDTDTIGAYQGVSCKDYVYYEGNIKNPANCVISWDGLTGFDSETYINDYAVDKSPFHIRNSQFSMHTSIKGFKIIGKNLRYAIHCETAGYGYGADWEIGHMILEWYGRPDVTNNSNDIPAIGTGSSPFEKGYFHDIDIICNSTKYNGTSYKFGFQNHDNVNKYKENPAVLVGANYRLENIKFNGSRFQLRSISATSADTFDTAELVNCVGIAKAEKIYSGNATKCSWMTDVKMCEIANNRL